MKMIDHNHFICHLILGTFTEYPILFFVQKTKRPADVSVETSAGLFTSFGRDKNYLGCFPI